MQKVLTLEQKQILISHKDTMGPGLAFRPQSEICVYLHRGTWWPRVGTRGLRPLGQWGQTQASPLAPAAGEGRGPRDTARLRAPPPECLQGEVGDVLPPSDLVAGGSASRGSPGGGGASI